MKKKLILTIVAVFTVNAALLSMENQPSPGLLIRNFFEIMENRLSFGLSYDNLFEKSRENNIDIEKYIGALGLDLHFYHLWNNFGFFHLHSYQFQNNVTSNTGKYSYFFRYNFIIGPAYKIAFTEKMDMTLGIGLSLGPIIGKLNDKSLTQFNIGLGGDIGVSFFLNKIAYVNIGGVFAYHFANVTSIDTGRYEEDEDGDREETHDTGWSDRYNMVGIRPYILFGIKL